MSGWRKRGKGINMDDKFKDLNIADVFTLRYHRTEDGNYQQTYTPTDFDLMQECVDRALGEYTQSMEVENNMLRARNGRLEALAQKEKTVCPFCSSEWVTAEQHDRKMDMMEQEPVAWRYKPVREDNPRWEYTTNHPLDMGDGYLRPSLVEYCKCIEPLYAKEKPKLMLEKFREMADLLEEPAQQEPAQQEPATKEQIREAIVFNLPLYTTPPPQHALMAEHWKAEYDKLKAASKPLTDEMVVAAARMLNERQADACGVDRDDQWAIYSDDFKADARAMLEAAHGIKE